MSTFLRFLLTAFLALVLVTGQGFTVLSSWAASCCPKPVIEKVMSCCHDGGCDKHKASNPVTLKQKGDACQCSATPVDLQQEKGSFLLDSGKLVGASSPNPTLSLQLADSDTPIWLYRLFYPDKSKLYLEKNSWLL